MSPSDISKIINRFLVVAVFGVVLFLSLYLSDHLTWRAIAFSFFKASVSALVAWLFFLLLSETLLKSIVTLLEDKPGLREQGGLLYHLVKPDKTEIGIETVKKPKKSKN